jgi:hypothetical protein
MNNFNSNLHFIFEKMQNGLLNNLNTTICLKNYIPEHKNHIIDGEDLSLNFREAIMPKSQLIGIRCGEIYCARITTTDD